MTSDRWTRKVAALLAWPPDRALNPSDADNRAGALLSAALGDDAASLLPKAQEAARSAAGLDAPQVETGGSSVFRENPTVVHPLSGATHRLKLGDDLDLEVVSAAVQEAVERIRDDAQDGGDASDAKKRLFLSLWRRLPDEVKASSALPDGAWDLLPADPHLPSISSHHHASAASALAGAGETPALLLFTLGSPQAFVTTARRTQDYWMGSFLISHLMWEGMKSLADDYGPDAFLYPNLHGQPLVDKWLDSESVNVDAPSKKALQIANFPNVFTALVPTEDATDVADKVEQAIRDGWDCIGRNVKAAVEQSACKALEWQLNGDEPDADWSAGWDRQLKEFPDRLGVFWAVCPWGDPTAVLKACQKPDDRHPLVVEHVKTLLGWIKEQDSAPNAGMTYALFSNLAGGELASRKALRDFPKVLEPKWKCSLCGEREALHPEWDVLGDHYGSRREEVLLRLFWEDLAKVGREDDAAQAEKDDEAGYQKLAGRIRHGDRLCAVCLTKRLALDTHFSKVLGFRHLLFPSTATLATAPFKAALLNALDEGGELAKAIADYTRAAHSFLRQANAFYYSASVPKLEALGDDVAHDAAESFLRLDGEWLYEEAFDPDKLRREYEVDFDEQPDLDESRQKALAALRALLTAAGQHGLGKPSRYYAILSMDGDKMGDRVRGRNGPRYEWMFHPDASPESSLPRRVSLGDKKFELQRPLGPATHQALSGVLKNFALRLARYAVEEAHRGKLIFAGGDDAVALVPIEDLLPVMRLLRTFFQGMDMTGPEEAGGIAIQTKGGFGWMKNGDGDARRFLLSGAPHERSLSLRPDEEAEGPTASIGVAVVHQNAPLVPSIEEAVSKAMKESAKEKAGRDAFAMHLLKRSGGPVHAVAPFFAGTQDDDDQHDVLALLQDLTGHLREDRLSARLANDLLERPIGTPGTDLAKWVREARRQELHRLARRHLTEPGNDDPVYTLDALLDVLHAAEEEQRQDLSESASLPLPTAWTTLANLIRLARFLAAETAHAD